MDHFSHLLQTLLSSSLFPNTALTIIPLHGKHTPAIRLKNYTRFLTTPTPTLLLTTDLAARGLDIPAVDLTLQLDPPSDPKTFLHRAGRAGRAGRKGLSVVFLLPERETEGYPDFLAVRKTPVAPLLDLLSSFPDNAASATSLTHILNDATNSIATSATKTLQKTALTDRALHDRAQRAFVSWVRSYRAHAAASIFRITDIDWVAQAEGWGLLRLPRMPELKGLEVDRTLGLKVDWDGFGYKDVKQEGKRVAELAVAREAQAARAGGAVNGEGVPTTAAASGVAKPPIAWSANHARKETAAQRRARKAAKREAVKVSLLDEQGRKERAEVQALVRQVREQIQTQEEKDGEEFTGFD